MVHPTLLSINVSQIKHVEWKGQTISTGIFKYPINGKQIIKGINILGDDQADRRAHGGENKAIYAYPIEHYPYWKEKFPNTEFHHGMFGENLTIQGILESNLNIGDRIHIGSTILTVVQPRTPCYKLGIKFGTQEMVKMFANAEKPGFYCRIDQEGEIEAGDKILIQRNDDPLVTIIDVVNIIRKKASVKDLKRAVLEPALPIGIRNYAEEILNHVVNDVLPQ